MENYRNTIAKINIKNLTHNYSQFLQYLGKDVFLCPMMKANAYGHGDVECATALERHGCQQIGVVMLEEAIKIRKSGIKMPILCFGIFDNYGAQALIEHDITPVVGSWQQWHAIEALKEKIDIHLKFNTGMSRLGFEFDDLEKVTEAVQATNKISVKGICTHLHSGENADNLNGSSQKQLDLLKTIGKEFTDFNIVFHALNTAGIMSAGKMYQQKNSFLKGFAGLGARPGIGMYGYTSRENSEIRLKPVLSLETEIIKLMRLKTNQAVSYGATWVAKKDSQIAVLPIGYADGYNRLFSNNANVIINDRRAPVVGRVCMDYIMVDVSEIPNVQLNQRVILLGQEQEAIITADELAERAQTISYEILTSVGPRVPRKYSNS